MSLPPSRFVHEFLTPEYKLERVQKEDGRYYILPTGEHVPSVTTVLSRQDTGWLDRWKARVGEEKANQISTQAKRRGTAIHTICEKYLLNDEDFRKGVMPFNFMEFKKIKPYLDENVGRIFGIECRLFSRELLTAGTCDLICEWKGINAIVDFKTSKYIKSESDIHSYFVQATAYALMAEELYGLSVPKIVIIMTVDHDAVLVFEKNKSDYLHDVHSIFKEAA